MNTLVLVVCCAVMATVASGLGYNSFDNFNNFPSVHRSAWGSLGSTGGSFLNGGMNLGRRGSYRQKRAAVGYGPYRSGVIGNLGGNFGGNFGGRLGSRLGGWRNSGLNAFNGY